MKWLIYFLSGTISMVAMVIAIIFVTFMRVVLYPFQFANTLSKLDKDEKMNTDLPLQTMRNDKSFLEWREEELKRKRTITADE